MYVTLNNNCPIYNLKYLTIIFEFFKSTNNTKETSPFFILMLLKLFLKIHKILFWFFFKLFLLFKFSIFIVFFIIRKNLITKCVIFILFFLLIL